MGSSALDYPALALGLVVAAVVASALLVADGTRSMRRVWITGGVLALGLCVAGLADLLQSSPRETPLLAPIIGAVVPVLGGVSVTRLSRRVRPVLRWLLLFVVSVVLLFGGLLLGVTIVTRVA